MALPSLHTSKNCEVANLHHLVFPLREPFPAGAIGGRGSYASFLSVLAFGFWQPMQIEPIAAVKICRVMINLLSPAAA
jgi:hypothetical protein